MVDEKVLTAKDIVALLAEAHGEINMWLGFAELRIGTGYGKDADQRLDYWAMHAWPSKHFLRIAYEVKISRGDFQREIINPAKRKIALLLSNEFYFVAPQGLINPAILPPESGLMEVRHSPRGLYLHTAVPAPHRDTPPPSWRFLAAVIRRSLKGRDADG